MIIPELGGVLTPRQYYSGCPSGYHLRNGRCYQSNWSYWGRWVLAGIIVAFFLALFLTWSCISNRRRRRRGLNPRYGTGWMMGGANNGQHGQPQYGNGWFGHNKNNHNNQQYYNQQQQAPPQYTPPAQGPLGNQYTGQTFNSNEGYYGHHNNNNGNDVPLQQPGSSYYPRGGDNVYEPPAGPPPAKS